MKLGGTQIPKVMPGKGTIIQFVVGAVVGFIVDKIMEYIVSHEEVKKHVDLTVGFGPFHADDFILLVVWILIALKKPALGAGGLVGTIIGSVSGWTPWVEYKGGEGD